MTDPAPAPHCSHEFCCPAYWYPHLSENEPALEYVLAKRPCAHGGESCPTKHDDRSRPAPQVPAVDEARVRADERQKVCNELGVLTGEDAKKFHDYLNSDKPIESPEAKKLIAEAWERSQQPPATDTTAEKVLEEIIKHGLDTLDECEQDGYSSQVILAKRDVLEWVLQEYKAALRQQQVQP